MPYIKKHKHTQCKVYYFITLFILLQNTLNNIDTQICKFNNSLSTRLAIYICTTKIFSCGSILGKLKVNIIDFKCSSRCSQILMAIFLYKFVFYNAGNRNLAFTLHLFLGRIFKYVLQFILSLVNATFAFQLSQFRNKSRGRWFLKEECFRKY